MPYYRYPKAVDSTYNKLFNIQNSVNANPDVRGTMFNLEQVPRALGEYPLNSKTLAQDSYRDKGVLPKDQPLKLLNNAKLPCTDFTTY